MTIHLPESLESSILEAVHRGQFASVDDAMTEAARLLLQRINQHRARQPDDPATAGHTQAEDEPNSQDLQRRLYDAGLLSEIKPPITDLTPYRDRQAVPIQGESLSATVIGERR